MNWLKELIFRWSFFSDYREDTGIIQYGPNSIVAIRTARQCKNTKKIVYIISRGWFYDEWKSLHSLPKPIRFNWVDNSKYQARRKA